MAITEEQEEHRRVLLRAVADWRMSPKKRTVEERVRRQVELERRIEYLRDLAAKHEAQLSPRRSLDEQHAYIAGEWAALADGRSREELAQALGFRDAQAAEASIRRWARRAHR